MRLISSLLAVTALAAAALMLNVPEGHAKKRTSAPARSCNALTFHDEQREGGVCCFTDHFHSGASSGQATKAKAMAEAVRSWQDFVSFEYGSAYSSWNRAHSKSADCSNGNGWSCSIEARPCH